jgi:CheY-like chemotaxis protein
MTILLVEDNVLNRRLAEVALEARGHHVRQADSADAARASLDQVVPDVILMDIEIPGGGGEALLREIRAQPARARLPIIAVTALAMQGDRERLLRAGFDGYISKPIDVGTFGPEIEALVAARSG